VSPVKLTTGKHACGPVAIQAGSMTLAVDYLASMTGVDTWFERDRAHVALYWLDPEDETPDPNQGAILEFRDGDVGQLVEDGFLDPDNWHRSLLEYARYLGVATPEIEAEAEDRYHEKFGDEEESEMTATSELLQAFIKEFGEANHTDDVPENTVRDIVTELAHFCEENGIDFQDRIDGGLAVFREEQDEAMRP